MAAEPILVITSGKSVKGSKFGPFADFQRGLATAAASCGAAVSNPDRFADGEIGGQTMKVLGRVADCPSYAGLSKAEIAKGWITAETWKTVAPQVEVPGPLLRAQTMTGAHEGTDYTEAEFNVGTTDPGILTWGPGGATVGQAHQVQRILRVIDQRLPGVIDQAFGAEAPAIRTLAATNDDRVSTPQIVTVKADAARRATWHAGFSRLGEQAPVRAIYDEIMGSHGAGVPTGISDFFRSYWRHCWRPTEIDLGYFYDRVIQLDVRQARTDRAADTVAEVEKGLGRKFSAAERRRAISANFPAGNTEFIADRLWRDVVFYVDGMPEAALTDSSLVALRPAGAPVVPQLKGELDGWRRRTGSLRASSYGLSDTRPAPTPATLIEMEKTVDARCPK